MLHITDVLGVGSSVSIHLLGLSSSDSSLIVPVSGKQAPDHR